MFIRLDVNSYSIDRAPLADAAACGVAADERPLRGPAGLVDWRLCGSISRHLLSGRFQGRVDEDMLVGTAGHLPFPRLFLFGLGRDAAIDSARARKLTTHASAVMLRAGVRSAVVALWDLTRERISFEDGLHALLLGCAHAVSQGMDADHLDITLLARSPAESGRLSHHVDQVVKQPGPGGLMLVRFMDDSCAGQRYS